ncbi:branched-chain amino acid ABC transporter substrate-binding protein [Lentzea sp. NBRC 105346]|uniref:ABC transporter substrate-binding protein n=1 Tax=Lentzea sp. NBRC 105346 TaxID=3032205 RepID=UPI0024A11870|nr:ABC transporter substrate-binding protein [Lentzea sp. NBRC 105346]GLZ28561.1 branched-chain amino acid ABC transporter substrate-binding protein [Lentzea sp. NBRC 105346]
MTGPFKSSAILRIRGYELYLDHVNQHGGVCGRRIELKQKDHGFNVQRALDGYFELEPEVLGFIDVAGSAMTEAIEPDLMQTRALTVPGSWAAALLGNPHMMIVGTTYDLDIINGVDHYRRKGILKQGDTVGHVYIQGNYGDNALEGTEFAATNWGLTVAKQPIGETTADLTTQIAALKAAGAKAVVLSTTPPQTAVAVGVAAALKWDVPFLVNVVGYDPAILESPVAAAVQKNVTVATSVAPFVGEAEGPREVRQGYQAKFPGEKASVNVDHGYAVAMAFVGVLEKACGKNDLTRDGVLRAFHDTSAIDTKGLTGPLRFSLVGRPSATQSYMTRPDAQSPGGLAMVEELRESELVKAKGTRAK